MFQESPLRPEGTIEARGIRITLFLGLEKSEHGHSTRPEQILVVRKSYSKVVIDQMSARVLSLLSIL